MTFGDDLLRFVTKCHTRTRATFAGVATKAHQSITVGHPATGAPGQPVDIGNLVNSWKLALTPVEATISTNVEYAPGIEDGIAASGKPIQFRSAVGGAHSVKLTVAGADALQAEALAELGP
jgi:hypothetical protein